jgi:hypothetical protein
LAAAVFALAGALPHDASAQSSRSGGGKKKPAAAAGPIVDRARGAKEAPAAVQAAGLRCAISDAAYVGMVKDTTGATRLAYEVSCTEGLGYLVQVGQAGASTQSYDCLVVAESAREAQAAGRAGAAQCRLPGNANPAQGLQPLIASAGGTCTVSNARYVGSRPTGGTLYEITCTQGSGFVLERPATNAVTKPTLTPCLAVAGTEAACTLTSPAQVVASIAPLAAQAQRPCTVSNARIAGANPQTKNQILEVGCADNRPGFLMEVSNTGGFVRALDCDRVQGLTCQFTSQATLQASGREALLSRVRAAGLQDCTPADVRVLGAETRTGREVVELACSNRPYGAIALLAAGPNTSSEVHDCLMAPRWGGSCQLSPVNAAYPRVSSALRVRGKSPNCQISNARWMGFTTQGENWFDISCADGRSFIMDYRGNGQVANVLTCREGAEIGGGCRAGIRASVPKD